MNPFPSMCLYVALMALPALAYAQQKTRPDPADPKAGVPPSVYVSPFKQYQPLGDEPVAPWKSTNEVVEKAGGWKAYAKEAQQPDVGTKPPVSPAQQPKPAGHDGHAGHQQN